MNQGKPIPPTWIFLIYLGGLTCNTLVYIPTCSFYTVDLLVIIDPLLSTQYTNVDVPNVAHPIST